MTCLTEVRCVQENELTLKWRMIIWHLNPIVKPGLAVIRKQGGWELLHYWGCRVGSCCHWHLKEFILVNSGFPRTPVMLCLTLTFPRESWRTKRKIPPKLYFSATKILNQISPQMCRSTCRGSCITPDCVWGTEQEGKSRFRDLISNLLCYINTWKWCCICV